MTDPNLEESQASESPTHVEVEPPSLGSEPPPPAAPVAAAAPPRAFPQHYRLLFGSFCVLIGAMTVWEREHVFGATIEGEDMISGTLLTILAGYSVIVGALNIMHGRLAGMLAAFMTGVLALYFGIPGIWGTWRHEQFIALNEVNQYIEKKTIPERFAENPDLEFPKEVFESFTSKQDTWKYVMGQFAPGPLWTTFGGALLLWVFLSAMFGGKKKKEPEPAPSRRRGRR